MIVTERSLDRPWILFEAGVAKGNLNTPVVGIALGVPLGRVSTGPFYQFQNMDDSEADLTKLVHQLARRVPNLELDVDVVKAQVAAFKTTAAEILKALPGSGSKKEAREEAEENPVSKLVEEMKTLPSRVAEQLAEGGDPTRRRRYRRFHPMVVEELMMRSRDTTDVTGILIAASLVRDEAPWLYELALEGYRALRSGDVDAITAEITRLRHFEKFLRGPLMEEISMGGKDQYMMIMEFPHILEHVMRRALEKKKTAPRSRAAVAGSSDQS